ncbi:MAG TPA: serine hydrolase [Candidatus Saccharimonadales bacterium]|nr:serine hydrolase [Candidatus Saccharimonadales bacterium]
MQAPLPTMFDRSSTPSTTQVQSLGDSVFDRTDISNSIKNAVLRYRIQQVINANTAAGVSVTGVDIYDFQAHQTIVQENENSVQFAASINKLPVAWLTLQDLRAHKFNLTDTVTWQASDVRAGYGTYDQPGAPTSATVQDVLYDMLNHSGNTAVRILVNYELGGAAAVNDRLATYPQIPNTRLQPLDATRFYVGNSTAKESLWVMTQLMSKADNYQRFIKNALATNIFTDYGVRSQLAGNDYIVLVNKVGILDDPDGNNRHDVGIVYNTKTHKSYGYSFMTTTPYENTDGTATAQTSLGTMGKDVLRLNGDKAKKAGSSAVTPFAATATPRAETKILY